MIRDLRYYSVDDLYNEYLKIKHNVAAFDAVTLNLSIYLPPHSIQLSKQNFLQKTFRTSLYRYVEVTTYKEYVNQRESLVNVILPNGEIASLCKFYSEKEYNSIINGIYVEPKSQFVKKDLTDSVYHTNKIENIGVTLEDTVTILAGGKVAGVKYDDEVSISNAKDAYELRQEYDLFVTEPYYICRLNYELLKGLREDAGRYRTYNVKVGSASHQPPDFKLVPELMDNLSSLIDPKDNILTASLIHAAFEKYHPFGDGNGRVGRLICHPFTVIPFTLRMEYYIALDAYGLHQSIMPMWELLYALNSDKVPFLH